MKAPTHFSLADTLSVMLPYVPAALAAPQARASLLRLAMNLPPIARVLLECRLGEASRVDLSLCVSDSEFDKALLPQFLNGRPDRAAPWHRVARFIDWWCKENLSENRLKTAWLEFDVDEESSALPLPSVFLHLNESRARPATAQSTGIADALECLQPGAARCLDDWLALLPPNAVPTFVGVMLSRPGEALRLNVAGLPGESAWAWLARQHVLNPRDETLFKQIYRLGGNAILAVDVNEALGPRVGLECRPANDIDSRALFDVLVASGLSGSNKYDSILDWTGYLSVLDKGTDWPLSLALEALIRSDIGTSTLVRHLNHVKVVLDESGATDAKVYLAYNHAVYSSDDRNEVPPR